MFSTKIEDVLSRLQQFPYLHQRTKWLAFCTNTRPNYFLGTVYPRNSNAIVHQLEKSVDNLWAHTNFFHRTMHIAQLPNTISRLCDNIAWASAAMIREGGTGCFDSLISFT